MYRADGFSRKPSPFSVTARMEIPLRRSSQGSPAACPRLPAAPTFSMIGASSRRKTRTSRAVRHMTDLFSDAVTRKPEEVNPNFPSKRTWKCCGRAESGSQGRLLNEPRTHAHGVHILATSDQIDRFSIHELTQINDLSR